MVLSHRVDINQVAGFTNPLPHSESAIVHLGTGTGAPGGALAAFNTPTAVTTVAQATASFGLGTILDAVTYIESVVDVTIYGIRVNSGLSGSALQTAVNGGIDAVARAGVGTNTLPKICIVDPEVVQNDGTLQQTPGTADGATNANVTRLQAICDRNDILLILDGDVAAANPLNVVSTYNTNNGGYLRQVNYGLINTANKTGLPVSVAAAALVAYWDGVEGIQEYPENRVVPGVISATPALTTGEGSDVATLDAANVGGVALSRGQYYLFGGVSHTAVATDARRFIGFERALRRIDDLMRQEAERYVGRNLSPQNDLEPIIANRLNEIITVEVGRGLLRPSSVEAARPATGADPNTLYFNTRINGIPVLRTINISQLPSLA